jgi:hypothetical protein
MKCSGGTSGGRPQKGRVVPVTSGIINWKKSLVPDAEVPAAEMVLYEGPAGRAVTRLKKKDKAGPMI